MIRLGVIGQSEGNGHPFSFSAIINGYDKVSFEKAGWNGILEYLERQPKQFFGLGTAQVTHAWTQSPQITAKLCAACLIPRAAESPQEMIEAIDALIIARDDWEVHADLAMPFLRLGIPVFVDKPLTLNPTELAQFEPYLKSGLLMSTSGLRYAVELDVLKARLPSMGKVRLITASVVNGMDKYGIHMLDVLSALDVPDPIAILRLPAEHQAYSITLADGSTIILNCLGAVCKTFHLSIFGDHSHMHVDLVDNFTAFRRTLGHFLQMVVDRVPPIEPVQVIKTMNLVRVAHSLRPGDSVRLPIGT